MRRSTANAAVPSERLAFLEGLRGLAALYVVLGHFCSMVDPSRLTGQRSEAPEWLRAAMAPFAYGHLAVAAFIVISGFCLQLSLYHNGTGRLPNLRRWFHRRGRRILPPYYACLGLSLLVCVTVTETQRGMPFALYTPATRENVLAHIFLIHNWSLDWMYKINGVLWSIAIEAQLYLVFPLLVGFLNRFGRVSLIGLTGLITVVAFWVLPNAMKLYPWYLALFALGMAAAHYSYRPNLRAGTVPLLANVLGVLFALGCIQACRVEVSLAERDAWLGMSVSAFAYAWTVQPKGLGARALGWRPLVALGTFSYSLYLIHHPIQQVLYVFRPRWVQSPGPELLYLLIVGLPLILLASHAFYRMFERPFISRRVVARQPEKRRELIPASLPLRTYAASRVVAERHVLVDPPAVIARTY